MSTGYCIDALLRTIKRSIPVTLVVFAFVAVAAAQTPTYLNLPVPPDTFSVAFGVNSLGQVVGAYAVKGGGEQLFVWRNGVTTLIGTPVLTPNVIVWAAINNRGQVAYTIDRPITSYLWDNGDITTLGNFVVSAAKPRLSWPCIQSECSQRPQDAGERNLHPTSQWPAS